eukprot:5345073-Alexandrium_andersonii.AAC.1
MVASISICARISFTRLARPAAGGGGICGRDIFGRGGMSTGGCAEAFKGTATGGCAEAFVGTAT